MESYFFTKCLVLFVAVLRFTDAGLMDMEPADLANAYIDAGIDNLKSVLDGHSNHTYGQFDSDKCFQQIKYFKAEAKAKQFWALKVIDSWSKIPSGLASGNIRDLGNFDQCLSIEQNSSDPVIGTFRGHFCVTPLTLIMDETTAGSKKLDIHFK